MSKSPPFEPDLDLIGHREKRQNPIPMLYPDHQEMALNRVAVAVERLTEAMAAPPGVDLVAWVDSLSPIELDAAVNDLLRKGERGNCMELVLMVLRDWASRA